MCSCHSDLSLNVLQVAEGSQLNHVLFYRTFKRGASLSRRSGKTGFTGEYTISISALKHNCG